MRHFYTIFIPFLIIFIIHACSPSQMIAPVKCEYEKGAIKLDIAADAHLNWDRTLHLCVYQLEDPNSFSQLTGSEEGLRELLHYKCALFNHKSKLAAESLDIKPGQGLTLTLDRYEGTKFVAVAAGYYELQKKRVTEWIEIPVVEKKKSFFSFKKIKQCDRLNIDLTLGKEQIQTFKKR